ncbi:MAG: CBS domain-containing protein [Candidatus Binatia bacterium]
MKLSDIMTRDVEVLSPDDRLDEAARRMKALDVGLMPVCDGDRLLGMLTDRDITVRAVSAGRAPRETAVVDIMTADVVYCFEDQDVEEAARLMHDAQIRRLPILNRNKRLTGIVALADLAVRTGDDQLSGRVLAGVSQPARH